MAAFLIVGPALVMPGPARAANECGPVPANGGAVHCAAGTYASTGDYIPAISYDFSYSPAIPDPLGYTGLDSSLDIGTAASPARINGGVAVSAYFGGSVALHLRNVVIDQPASSLFQANSVISLDEYQADFRQHAFLTEMDGGLIRLSHADNLNAIGVFDGGKQEDSNTVRLLGGTIDLAGNYTYGLRLQESNLGDISAELHGGELRLAGEGVTGVLVDGSGGYGTSAALQTGGSVIANGIYARGVAVIGQDRFDGAFSVTQFTRTGGSISVSGDASFGADLESYGGNSGVRFAQTGGSIYAAGGSADQFNPGATALMTYSNIDPAIGIGIGTDIDVTGGELIGTGQNALGIFLANPLGFRVHLGGTADVEGGAGFGAGLIINNGSAQTHGSIRIDGTARLGATSGRAITVEQFFNHSQSDATADVTIADHAVVDGSITLGTGSDLLTWSGGSITGPVDLGGGDDQLVLEGVTVGAQVLKGGAGQDRITIAGNGVTRLDLSQATGFEMLEKTGLGSAILTGASRFSGGIAVNQGALSFNGDGGALSVDGARLGGNGTLAALTTTGSAVVAPGNSIGTLHVRGNVDLGAGSVMEVEVNRDGRGDRLEADGHVSIGANSSLHLLPELSSDRTGRTYFDETRYTILSAAGGLSGRFSSVLEDFAFLDAALDYTGTSAILTLKRNYFTFADTTDTANRTSIASAFDAGGWQGSPLYGSIVTLSNSQTMAAFDTLAGEVHADVPAVLSAATAALRGGISDHLKGDAPFGGWLTWQAMAGTHSGDGNSAALTWQSNGARFGTDLIDLGALRLGIAGAIGETRLNLDQQSSDARGQVVQAGAYASWQGGGLHLDIGGTVDGSTIDSRRTATIGRLSQRLAASYPVSGHHLFAEAGYSLKLSDTVTLMPFAGFSHLLESRDGFSETGGTAGLTVAAQSYREDRLTAGAELSAELSPGAHALLLKGGIAYDWLVSRDAAESTQHLDGTPDFTVTGSGADGNRLSLTGGLALALTPSMQATLTYTGTIAPNARSHALSLNLRGAF